MTKYDKLNKKIELKQIKDILMENENIIWQGKPKKKAYMINSLIGKIIFWSGYLLFSIIMFVSMVEDPNMPLEAAIGFLMGCFILCILIPFFIWLSTEIFLIKKWNKTEYAITDKRIIIISGFISMNYQTVYYSNIKEIKLNINFFDKLLKVGDIIFETKESIEAIFFDIENVQQVYKLIQKTVFDIQTDIEFPNNLRPDKNDGYNTKYNSKF